MFQSLDVPTDKTPRVWPLGGYAPGSYACRCISCEMIYSGEKRSYSCLPCAIHQLKSKVETKQPVNENISQVTIIRHGKS